jgi:GT2 family glycosyltransferase
MSARRLAVVVLTWNGREDTLACLASLRGQLGADDAVIVVDNGSKDGTEDAVRAAHPWVEVVQTGANLGFAGGNNAGLRLVVERGYAWALVLNNDTLVPVGALDALLAHAAERPGVGAFQPLLVSAAAPARIDGAGHLVHRCPGVVDALMGRPVADAPRDATPIFGACAAAALLRVEALAEVGLFDETLFVLCEDADLMFRLRLAGHEVELVPSVHVLHKRGVSGRGRTGDAARRRKYWLQRNTIALAIRYWPTRWIALSAPVLAFRVAQALWLSTRLPGERCLPLWGASREIRADNRRRMRRHGVDRWFSARPVGSPR